MTTELAMDLEPVERRAQQRYVAVLMIGRIDWNGRQQPCLVRNMSATGMMVEATALPAAGDTVRVQCRTLAPTLAVVRWVRHQRAGLELLDNEASGVADAAGARRRPHRAPRFAATLAARLQQGDHTAVARVRNVSAGGLCVEGEAPLVAGQPLLLTLPDVLGATPAHIVWMRDQEMGLRFNQCLSIDALERVIGGAALVR